MAISVVLGFGACITAGVALNTCSKDRLTAAAPASAAAAPTAPDPSAMLAPKATQVSPTEVQIASQAGGPELIVADDYEEASSKLIDMVRLCKPQFAALPPSVTRCTVLAEVTLQSEAKADDPGKWPRARLQASIDRASADVLTAGPTKDVAKALQAMTIPTKMKSAWYFVTDSFPNDAQRAAYTAAKAKAAAAADLNSRIESLVGGNSVKSFASGQLVVQKDDGEADSPMNTSLDTLKDLAKGFEDIKELQVITVVETAEYRNGNGVMQPARKIAEVRISRARAATIDWEHITMKNLLRAIDAAWASPDAPFIVD